MYSAQRNLGQTKEGHKKAKEEEDDKTSVLHHKMTNKFYLVNMQSIFLIKMKPTVMAHFCIMFPQPFSICVHSPLDFIVSPLRFLLLNFFYFYLSFPFNHHTGHP